MKTQALLAATATAALMAGAANAQDMDFATVDADASGDITVDELQAEASMTTQADFDEYDADADGVLNEDEFAAWQAESSVAEADVTGETDMSEDEDDMGEAITSTASRETGGDAEADAELEAPSAVDAEVEAGPEAVEYDEPASEDDEALPAKLTTPETTASASGAATDDMAATDMDYGTEDDQISLLGSFTAIDADGNFEVSANEWSNWQAEDSANRTNAFSELDDDGSGRVVFTEFADAYGWTPVAAVAVPAVPVEAETALDAETDAAGMTDDAEMDAEADADLMTNPDDVPEMDENLVDMSADDSDMEAEDPLEDADDVDAAIEGVPSNPMNDD